jgi:hypothetical protein
MIINEVGQYKLLEDIKTSNSFSVGTILKDIVLNITQIDKVYYQVIANELMDWTYWDLPVVKIK